MLKYSITDEGGGGAQWKTKFSALYAPLLHARSAYTNTTWDYFATTKRPRKN